MNVAIVILNWNGKSFLEQFLPSVIQNSPDYARVIVADNDSDDDSVVFLESAYPDIQIIKNKTNGGFAKGYNDALSQVDADYYVLLNSDIEVTPGWVEPIINMMHADESIAACQPKLLTYHKKTHFEYAGGAGGFLDKYGYPFCRGRIFEHNEEDTGQYDDTCEVFWATGACMFVKAELYHRFGGLDNDFFAHMEEIDFCWRLKNEGYKIMYCPDSVVYHVGGGTLPKKSSRKTYLNFRNNFILLYKNMPGKKIFPVFAARLFLDLIAALKFLAEGGFPDFMAVIKAHLHFYRSFRRHHKKRKDIKRGDVSCIYNGNIVARHYLGKINKFSQLDPKRFSS